MDEELNIEQSEVLYDLAHILCFNGAEEAGASKYYTDQLKIIERAKVTCADKPAIMEYLERLEAATREKISDELNHAHSLLEEYQELTGIMPAKD